MVQTIVTPQKEKFDMTVSLPTDYVGKEVHVLFYIDEEVKNTVASVAGSKKPSDYIGILTAEEGNSFDKHIQQMRTEWNRDI